MADFALYPTIVDTAFALYPIFNNSVLFSIRAFKLTWVNDSPYRLLETMLQLFRENFKFNYYLWKTW
ncbi:hypothetical protein FHS57_006293 [Runella defluvii]|uniref:Uncharacterized protein n=1 Tax=Runella defluvii TaxID=370973 RepID=A0A7W5ZVE7_9BACT|nr:hypothetical protein [Runella defluvii]